MSLANPKEGENNTTIKFLIDFYGLSDRTMNEEVPGSKPGKTNLGILLFEITTGQSVLYSFAVSKTNSDL